MLLEVQVVSVDMDLLLQCGFQPLWHPRMSLVGERHPWDSFPNTYGAQKLPSNPWYPSSPPVVPTRALATWGGMEPCMLCEILVPAMRICTGMPTPARDKGSASPAEFPMAFKDARSHWPLTIQGA